MKPRLRGFIVASPPGYAEEGWINGYCYEPLCGTQLLWWWEAIDLIEQIVSSNLKVSPEVLGIDQPGMATLEHALTERAWCHDEGDESWIDWLNEQQLYYERNLV